MIVAEKPRFGLGISIAAGITNMVLDFLFIYVFRLGVAGTAIATITSQTVGAIIPLIYFSRKNDTMLKLGKTKFDELKSLLSKSLKLLGIIAIIMTGLAEILAKPLASIFVSYDKELLEITI